MDRVRVFGGIDIGSRLVNRRMYHVGCSVEKLNVATVENLAFFVDSDKIRGLYQGEGNAKRIHPERVWLNWVLQSILDTNSPSMLAIGD